MFAGPSPSVRVVGGGVVDPCKASRLHVLQTRKKLQTRAKHVYGCTAGDRPGQCSSSACGEL